MLQHGAYTLLIDSCYDREKFPTKEEAIEWTWASSSQEVEAVEFVLSRFFVLENGVYVQNRIKEELEDFHEKSQTNARIAIERETKRRENRTNRARDVHEAPPIEHEPPPNHKPLTINQEPITPKSPKGDRTQGIELKTFLETCKQKNEKPISGYTPVFSYAESVGLPTDFIQLAWFEFCRQFGDGGVNESRKQKDWRKTFRNYVEKGYLKLWWITPEGRYELTTNGKQAQLANSERLAA